MGLFSNIFGSNNEPSREHWSQIIEQISKELTVTQSVWFAICAEDLLQNIDENANYAEGIEARAMIRAFQLLTVSSYMKKYKFISPSNAGDFAIQLAETYCRNEVTNKDEVDDMLEYYSKYREYGSEPKDFTMGFLGDLTTNILSRESGTALLRLSQYVPSLINKAGIATAKAFGFHKIAVEIEQELH